VKPAPAIIALIAGACLAGWLLTLIPTPVRADGADFARLAGFAAGQVCLLARALLGILREFGNIAG